MLPSAVMATMVSGSSEINFFKIQPAYPVTGANRVVQHPIFLGNSTALVGVSGSNRSSNIRGQLFSPTELSIRLQHWLGILQLASLERSRRDAVSSMPFRNSRQDRKQIVAVLPRRRKQVTLCLLLTLAVGESFQDSLYVK